MLTSELGRKRVCRNPILSYGRPAAVRYPMNDTGKGMNASTEQ